MDIDIECLRDAKIENLERLATSLGLRLPARKRAGESAYSRELVRQVAKGLRNDKAQQERSRFSARRFWS